MQQTADQRGLFQAETRRLEGLSDADLRAEALRAVEKASREDLVEFLVDAVDLVELAARDPRFATAARSCEGAGRPPAREGVGQGEGSPGGACGGSGGQRA